VIAPLLTLVLLGAPPLSAGGDARTRTLADALEAFAALPAERVDDLATTLDDAARGRCRSSLASLRAPCLEAAVQARCDDDARCRRVGDVLITLKLAESTFVKTSERHRVLRQAPVFRRGLRQATTRAHARLVTGLVPLAQGCGDDRRCLAAAIDRFCVHHAQARGLSWHRCAAATTAFIGRRQP
jgi:hypothetical protein